MVTAVFEEVCSLFIKAVEECIQHAEGKIARWNWTVRERYDSERREARS
jgi:hypothetical protein